MYRQNTIKFFLIKSYHDTELFPLLFISFVCLVFFVLLENFSLIWIRHHYRWKAANFELCSALIAIRSKGSLARHTYCDTGHLFIMVIFEEPWHSHLLPSALQWSCRYLFSRPVATGTRTPFSLQDERSKRLRQRRGI